jgi:hypothetical protein
VPGFAESTFPPLSLVASRNPGVALEILWCTEKPGEDMPDFRGGSITDTSLSFVGFFPSEWQLQVAANQPAGAGTRTRQYFLSQLSISHYQETRTQRKVFKLI